MDSVAVQMRKRWTRSQGRGGQGIDSVQLQMWVGGGLGPGAEVGGYEPSPVMSEERSPPNAAAGA